MLAARLKRNITFLKEQTNKSASGAETKVWNTFYSCKADIKFKSGNKIINDNELFTSQFLEINIRYRSDIDESLQINYNNRLYRILFINEPDWHQMLTITAEKLLK